MFQSLEVLRMAQALASHAGQRQAVIARNVAHADTPGFQARDLVPFADAYALAGSARDRAPAPVRLDPTPATRSPNGNTVSLEAEMMRAAESRHAHEMALGIYSMSRDILRASIGK